MRGPELAEPVEELTETPTPRIYVASLSDYNAMRLHGVWLDADQPIDELHSEVQTMLQHSPEPGAEEIAIHDYEGFGGWMPGEYESLEVVNLVAAGITEHGPAFGHWAAFVNADLDDMNRFNDAYMGEYDSPANYAEQIADEIGVQIHVEPDNWAGYVRFDTEALGRDLQIEMYMPETEDGGVYVFDPSLL